MFIRRAVRTSDDHARLSLFFSLLTVLRASPHLASAFRFHSHRAIVAPASSRTCRATMSDDTRLGSGVSTRPVPATFSGADFGGTVKRIADTSGTGNGQAAHMRAWRSRRTRGWRRLPGRVGGMRGLSGCSESPGPPRDCGRGARLLGAGS